MEERGGFLCGFEGACDQEMLCLECGKEGILGKGGIRGSRRQAGSCRSGFNYSYSIIRDTSLPHLPLPWKLVAGHEWNGLSLGHDTLFQTGSACLVDVLRDHVVPELPALLSNE